MPRSLFTLTLALFASLSIQAKTPNLTGTWKLNVEKSSAGAAASKALVYKVKDTPDGLIMTAIQIDAEGKETTTELKFDRNGKETVNQASGLESRTKLSDDEDALREVSTFTGPSGSFTRKSAITLSEDGKTMTMDSVFSSPRGDTPVKLVFEKQ